MLEPDGFGNGLSTAAPELAAMCKCALYKVNVYGAVELGVKQFYAFFGKEKLQFKIIAAARQQWQPGLFCQGFSLVLLERVSANDANGNWIHALGELPDHVDSLVS